jgi:hypothetical protein
LGCEPKLGGMHKKKATAAEGRRIQCCMKPAAVCRMHLALQIRLNLFIRYEMPVTILNCYITCLLINIRSDATLWLALSPNFQTQTSRRTLASTCYSIHELCCEGEHLILQIRHAQPGKKSFATSSKFSHTACATWRVKTAPAERIAR